MRGERGGERKTLYCTCSVAMSGMSNIFDVFTCYQRWNEKQNCIIVPYDTKFTNTYSDVEYYLSAQVEVGFQITIITFFYRVIFFCGA